MLEVGRGGGPDPLQEPRRQGTSERWTLLCEWRVA